MSKNVENSRPEVLQILLAVLDGENFLSRCTAVNAVGRVGGQDAASRKRLVELLSDPDPTLRMESAAALGRMRSGDAAEALLASLAGDPIDDVRTQVAVALSEISAPDSLDSLIDCLANGGYPHLDEHIDEMEFGASWEVRGHALKAIGEIGDPAAVQAVIDFIDDEDNEDLQESGFRVLAGLGGSTARAFLIGQLRSGSALARRRAAKVLGRGGGGAADEHILPQDIFDALGHAVADATPAVRIAAAQALGGSKDSRASALLIGLLDDEDWDVQSAAAEILGGFGGAEIATHLHSLLNNTDPKFQARIVRILGQVASPVSIEPLEALLESDQEELQFEVVGALGNIGHSHCVVQIAEILDNSAIGNDFRLQVIRTLERLLQPGANGKIDGAEVTPRDKKSLGLVCAILDEALDSEDERVVYAALSALIEIEGARAQQRLLTLLQPEPEPPQAPETEAPEEAGATAESGAAPDEIADEGAEQGGAQISTLGSIEAGFPGLPEEAEGANPLADSEPEFDHHREILRLLAARLLPRLGEVSDAAIEALMDVASAEHGMMPALNREAQRSLAEIGDARALPVLLAGLDSYQLETRLAALDGLGRFAHLPEVAARFAELLEDRDPDIRLRAVAAIAGAGAEGASVSACLTQALGDDHQAVCRAALDALSPATYIADHRALLLDLMFRFAADLRQDVARTLRQLDDAAAIEALLGMLKTPEKEEQHWVCIDALAELVGEEQASDA